MRKVAIFGGTFDPIHWGHLLIAETALGQVALDEVIWVPASCPPHKLAAKFEHRWEMVQRAIQDNPAFTISPLESNSSSPSYAFQTLIDFQALYPNTHWYWLVGLDAFQTLPRWYRHQQLVPACDWLVVPRIIAGEALEAGAVCQRVAEKLADQDVSIRWQLLPMPIIGISSSLIRQYCRDRCSIRSSVPESVMTYITSNNLYTDKTS